MRLTWLVLLFICAFLIAPATCMVLWNWLMPVIFGLPTIGYFQALGLVTLSRILIYSPSSSSSK